MSAVEAAWEATEAAEDAADDLELPDRSKWMEEKANHIREKTLRDIFIPGAHDAATASISPSADVAPDAEPWLKAASKPLTGATIANWSRAQGLSLPQQLYAGIRYLDLRVAKRKGSSAESVGSFRRCGARRLDFRRHGRTNEWG